MTTPTGRLATLGGVETLTNKTLTTPTIADLTNAQHAHTDAASGGTLSSSGALTRAGGNTVEATTTSITAVDLLSVASLTIATNIPILFMVSARKSTGASSWGALGLKLNATITSTPSVGILQFGTSANAESRHCAIWLGPRITNYNLQSSGEGITGALAPTGVTIGAAPTETAAQPIATITDIIVRAVSGDALVTVGADELHIYTYAVS